MSIGGPDGRDLPDLVSLADGLDGAAPGEARAVIRSVLRGARELLGLDVTFISEFREGQRVFRHVDSRDADCPVRVGGSDPLEATYCQRVVDGRLPEFLPDAGAHPEARSLEVTSVLPVGTHLSVPIPLADGRVYGTFCAFSHERDEEVRERDLGVMRLLARVVGRYLEREADEAARRSRAAADVLEVLALGSLRTVFQPIVDLRTGRPAGYEALSRFPSGRPDEWFARAAEAGLSVPLELAALEEAVRHLSRLPAPAYLSVNVSPATLASTRFADRAAGLPLDRLVIELTEQTEVTDYAVLLERVQWVRERGGRIAVDDAGSGYAGLQRIVAITPDILKLDAQLIRGVGESVARQAMASAMAWFAERVGATLVAEGVETPDELTALRGLGVGYAQGFHTGRPREHLG